MEFNREQAVADRLAVMDEAALRGLVGQPAPVFDSPPAAPVYDALPDVLSRRDARRPKPDDFEFKYDDATGHLSVFESLDAIQRDMMNLLTAQREDRFKDALRALGWLAPEDVARLDTRRGCIHTQTSVPPISTPLEVGGTAHHNTWEASDGTKYSQHPIDGTWMQLGRSRGGFTTLHAIEFAATRGVSAGQVKQ
jgi:hypothetical protein